MMNTVDRIADHLGPASQGLVWAHNTHIGDARATDRARGGMLNIGQLLRERHSAEGVALVGFAGHRGTVLAAGEWGVPEQVLPVPGAVSGSHEDLLHRALGRSSLLVFGDDRTGPWLSSRLGHRAIGVVYQPRREHGNYVPTRMGARYDVLFWFEETGALRPLHHEARPAEQEYETEPTGFQAPRALPDTGRVPETSTPADRPTRPRPCPCLSGIPYAECCGRFHRGEAFAPTAEALMRSRYAAFAVGEPDYLLATWHPLTRPDTLELDDDMRWLRLEIERTVQGGPFDSEGEVVFTAYSRSGGTSSQQHEVSRFVRLDRRWVYLGAV